MSLPMPDSSRLAPLLKGCRRPVVVVEDGELATRTILVGDFSAMYHIAYPDLEVMSSADAGFAKNSVLVRAVCRHTNICTYAAAFKKIVAVAD